jgi:hypothetical protein
MMVVIGGTEEQVDSSPFFCSTSQYHQVLLTSYCLPYFRLLNMPNHHTFTLKMATAVFAETDNFQNLSWLNPKS